MISAYEVDTIRLTVYSRRGGVNTQYYYKLWTKGMDSYDDLPNWPVGSTIYSRDDKWYWTFASQGYPTHEEANEAGLKMMQDIFKERRR